MGRYKENLCKQDLKKRPTLNSTEMAEVEELAEPECTHPPTPKKIPSSFSYIQFRFKSDTDEYLEMDAPYPVVTS